MSDIGRELFRIAEDFADLCRLRDILQSEGEDAAPVEMAIRQYLSDDVTRQKIDGVIGYLRYCYEMEHAAEQEMVRLKKLAKSWATQRDWLMECAKSVLEAGGQKRLEGKTAGYIGLRKNGGAAPVVITNTELLPEEFVCYEGRIDGRAWAWIEAWEAATAWKGRQDVQMERIPHKGRIAEALTAKCDYCHGDKSDQADSALPCPACDGTGHTKVPGAHLGDRGAHVEVR